MRGQIAKMKKKDKILLIRIIFAAFLFVASYFTKHTYIRYSVLALAYVLVGESVIKQAVLRMFSGKFFDENFLMMIATVGAVCVGKYSEAVAVMLFYQTGELFQSYAVGKSRKSIAALMDICPEYANLERDGEVLTVDPSEVKVGEVIVVKPGEKVPLDGVIISGATSFNTAPLTGESLPRDVAEGDAVSGGFINLTGLIRVRVSKEFSDSTVAKILELVESSSDNKTTTENFITKFSLYYTPAVVIAAAALAFIPPIFVGNFANWFHRALVFLVVSCPCALVISVPLSFFGGIGGASRNGILIKGSNYMEQLAKCKTFVFDKTGTLTRGEFEIVSINPEGVGEETLIRAAIIAEGGSNHPMAQAVISAFGKAKENAKISELAGQGVIAKLDGEEILAGNERLMSSRNIKVKEPKENGAVIYVAQNGKFIGSIVIADKIKEDAKAAIEGLLREGAKKTVMLTGDTKKNAEPVAKELGITELRAGLMPTDKVSETEKLIKSSGGVAFVGDGINDAPTLALSDVGIAMGAVGSDAAIEAADIVLMDDKPSKIPIALKIARKTMRIVRQNIVFALGVKGIVLLLGALGIANMWLAVFADVGVAFIAILNAMRTLRKI